PSPFLPCSSGRSTVLTCCSLWGEGSPFSVGDLQIPTSGAVLHHRPLSTLATRVSATPHRFQRDDDIGRSLRRPPGGPACCCGGDILRARHQRALRFRHQGVLPVRIFRVVARRDRDSLHWWWPGVYPSGLQPGGRR
ncbi:unnamed protein product, partial [Ectocarpus sp. 8 AP-2014]